MNKNQLAIGYTYVFTHLSVLRLIRHDVTLFSVIDNMIAHAAISNSGCGLGRPRFRSQEHFLT